MANISAPDAHLSFARKLTNMVQDPEVRHLDALGQMLREAPDGGPQGARFILQGLATTIPSGTARLNSGSLAYATRGLDMFYSLEHFQEHADSAVKIAEATLRAKGYDAKLDVAYNTQTDYQGKTYWNAHIRLVDTSRESAPKEAACG